MVLVSKSRQIGQDNSVANVRVVIVMAVSSSIELCGLRIYKAWISHVFSYSYILNYINQYFNSETLEDSFKIKLTDNQLMCA